MSIGLGTISLDSVGTVYLANKAEGWLIIFEKGSRKLNYPGTENWEVRKEQNQYDSRYEQWALYIDGKRHLSAPILG